jgi:DNA-binding IscR family transcriptional regulator
MPFMQLSARADYALRAAAELASAPEGRITAEDLARVRDALDANEQAVLEAVTLADLCQAGDLGWIRHRPRRPDGG